MGSSKCKSHLDRFNSGPSVQTEACGGQTLTDTWNCIYESSGAMTNRLNRTDVKQEIGPGCRCGCIVHLGSSKPQRMIAGAAQSCPGRSFWLIQVDDGDYIRLVINFVRLPCNTQYIRIRDGPSISSNLLIEIRGGYEGTHIPDDYYDNGLPFPLQSTKAQMLLEFYAGEQKSNLLPFGSAETDPNRASNSTIESSNNYGAFRCVGGFLATVQQFVRNTSSLAKIETSVEATRFMGKQRILYTNSKTKQNFTWAHLSVGVFVSSILLISVLLGTQYIVRYRKYHLAVARRQKEGSRLHTPRDSMTSFQDLSSRALSTTTILSEVIYLVKLRPKKHVRHTVLRESNDIEHLTCDTGVGDVQSEVPMLTVASESSVAESGSCDSIVTLTNEIISPDINTSRQTPNSERSQLASCNSEVAALMTSPAENMDKVSNNVLTISSSSCPPSTSDDINYLDNNSSSSGLSSIPQSPLWRRNSATIKASSFQCKVPISTIADTHSIPENKSKLLSDTRQLLRPRIDSVLTQGFFTSPPNVINKATVRSTCNPKESKEKMNRRKLLARPDSEFSLNNHEEFEMDYYDYNVNNAESMPGSYLGMDPAYLVWIPPFAKELSSPKQAAQSNDDSGDQDKTRQLSNQNESHIWCQLQINDQNQDKEQNCSENRKQTISNQVYRRFSTNLDNLHDSSIYRDCKLSTFNQYLNTLYNQRDSNPRDKSNASSSTSENSLKDPVATVDSAKDSNSSMMRRLMIVPGHSIPATTPNQCKNKMPIRQLDEMLREKSLSPPLIENNTKNRENKDNEGKEVCSNNEQSMESNELNANEETETRVNAMNESYVEKETRVVKSPSDLEKRPKRRKEDSDLNKADEIDVRRRSAKELFNEECQLLRNLKRVSTAIAANKSQSIKMTEL